MPPCFFFTKYGECSNVECMYRHINPEEQQKECAWYARGFCKHGPKCHHKHVKKIACALYMAGFCPNGLLFFCFYLSLFYLILFNFF